MNAGKLNRRVTIEQKSVTRAANGEEIVAWTTVAEVWASVEQLRGREFFAAAQMQDAVDARIVIRYRTGIAREMRARVENGATYDVVGVVETPAKTFIELMVVSGVRNGG